MNPEDGFESKYRYVVAAARRARQLQSGSQPLIDSRSTKACRVARDEIAAGKVTLAPPNHPEPAKETTSQAGPANDFAADLPENLPDLPDDTHFQS